MIKCHCLLFIFMVICVIIFVFMDEIIPLLEFIFPLFVLNYIDKLLRILIILLQPLENNFMNKSSLGTHHIRHR